MPPPDKIDVPETFKFIDEHWSPRIVADCNGQHVKLARLFGEFVWHKHDEADELFMIVKGSLDIEFRDGVTTLGEGELCVVPAGIEHRPVAREECHVLLFEPAGTINTGDAEACDLTVDQPARI